MQQKQTSHLTRSFAFMAAAAVLALSAMGQSNDNDWQSRRGDLTPGLHYTAIASSGSRTIAVGNGGRLMISDDGGTNWRFDQIRVGGRTIFGTPTDMVYFQGSFIAVVAQLEEDSGSSMKYAARTYLLKSSNGTSWSVQPFPHTTADFNGQTFHGVNLRGLQISPAGDLVAFGTTSVANSPFLIWNIGGLLYRSSDASNWVETEFAYGAIEQVSPVNGRLIAVGNTTVLDSADGSAWNGYTLSQANVQDPQGDLLDSKDRSRIRLSDVGTVGSTPVAIGTIFVPYDEAGNIDSSRVDQAFTLSSPNPFDGGRFWTAYPRSAHFGRLFNTGSSLLSFAGSGVYSVNANGQFSLIDSTVRVPTETVTASGSNIIALGSSEAVWRASAGGTNWTRVWDREVGPNLRVTSVVNGTIFAFGGYRELWASFDNGDNWELLTNSYASGKPQRFGDSLVAPGGVNAPLSISDDGGRSWRPLTTETSDVTPGLMTETPTGRLILASTGTNLSGNGEFFVSDDRGQTWQPRLVGHPWNETPSAVVTTPSGAVIAGSNSFASFNPRIMISEDNGETWSTNFFLRSLEGLTPISNEPGQYTIEIRALRASPSGRVLLLGEDEIVTSDDNGRTWRVRVNLGAEQLSERWLNWHIQDVIHTGVDSQWVAIGHYETPSPSRRLIVFMMISDDDGATWRRIPLRMRQSNTLLTSLSVTPDGRIVASGTNAAVYVLDPPAPLPTTPPPFAIREGTTGLVPVERPPVPGAVNIRYSAVERSARAGIDYEAAGGILSWTSDDQEPKSIPIETIDNNVANSERELALQMVFDSDDFQASNEVTVQITDDEGRGNPTVNVEGAANAVTTESGDTAEVRISLDRRPTEPVELTLADYDETEGELSATSFTFTAANWNVQQTLIITGIDDNLPDGDGSYEIRFTLATVDSLFANHPEIIIPVINRGREPYDPVALEGASPAPTPFPTPGPTPAPTPIVQQPALSPEIRLPRKFTSRNGKVRIKGQLSGNIARVQVKAGRGGFKNAKMRGNGIRFIFKAKNLPENRRKMKAVVRAFAIDGSRIVQRVRIIAK